MVMILENTLSKSLNTKILGTGSAGAGVVVLAHGYGADQSIWDKILPHLTTHYRVLVFDWSFSGAIDDSLNLYDPLKYTSYDAFADDMINLVDEMNVAVPAPVFIGHSMAGMIGCIASVKRPELFKRLILVGASPRYMNAKDYNGGFEASDIDELLSNIESNFNFWCPSFASLVVDSKDPTSIDKFAKCLSRMNPKVAHPMARIVFQSDERDTLEKVTTPCTIIQTTSDIVVPISVVEFMVEKLKGETTVEMVEADGHFPQLTAHEKLIEVLDKVLVPEKLIEVFDKVLAPEEITEVHDMMLAPEELTEVHDKVLAPEELIEVLDKPYGTGGIVIDPGAEISYILSPAYKALTAEVVTIINGLERDTNGRSPNMLCYKGFLQDLKNFPLVTLNFEGGQILQFNQYSAFYQRNNQMFCMAFNVYPRGLMNVIADSAQHNYNIGYDIERS